MRALHDKRDDHTKDENNNNGTNSNPVRLGRYDIDNRCYTNENNNSDIPESINSIMSDLHIIPLSKVKVTKTTPLSRATRIIHRYSYSLLDFKGRLHSDSMGCGH